MKHFLTILFGCIVILCVKGGTIMKISPDLKVEILKEVECRKAAQYGDRLHIHYQGFLEDGKEFDNSYARGHPVIFTLGGQTVIKAWDQGIAGMCEGEKRRLVSPPELAYGDVGFAGMIPPGATLTFDCELLHINLRDEL